MIPQKAAEIGVSGYEPFERAIVQPRTSPEPPTSLSTTSRTRPARSYDGALSEVGGSGVKWVYDAAPQTATAGFVPLRVDTVF